ncbi:YcaO-like family protein [Actinomycetospora termitidis]|uniref:YcaO-like family protein n=1 Tax=Actinomycetospora termitidis TaxID=3053470 RepID=A0ABT7M6M0_9PSEU|nr:YcaO-like family protein [Actinomycetospora sp. Odt1-22]MDL5156315.1 YcaO-like family protein [Actinomycetospora sp. Odt1-22]
MSLDAVAQDYTDALPPGETDEIELRDADRTGVHVVAADFADPSGHWPRSGSFGYGLSVERARVAARAELAEEMLLSRHLRTLERTRDSYTALRGRLGDGGVVDPVRLTLPAGSAYDPDAPRWWLPATRVRTGETVLVPAEFAAAYPVDLPWQDPAERLTTVITNGCGAGDTVERALGHALGELLQRDGNATAFRALDRGIVIDTGPDDELVADPDTRALLAHLRGVGVRVVPKLASTAFGVTDLHVVGYDAVGDPPHPIALTACGEAAHPDREVALQKALLEFCSARVRKTFAHADLATVHPLAPASYWDREFAQPLPPQEARAFRAMQDWTARDADDLRGLLEPVLAEHTRVRFDELPTTAVGHPVAVLDDLMGRLAEFDVLAVLADEGPACTVKVLVPGLEVETMSYGRIGRRGVDRLLDRAADPHDPAFGLVGLGDPPHAGALPVLLPDDEAARLADERGSDRAWLDRDRVDAVVGDLYPLYREPSRHAVARVAAGEEVELT